MAIIRNVCRTVQNYLTLGHNNVEYIVYIKYNAANIMGIEYVDGDEDILIEKEGKEEKRRILVKTSGFS